MLAQDVGQARPEWVGCTDPTAASLQHNSPTLHHRHQDHLGRQLRAMYEDLLQEPIPGRFLALIARLERQDREQGDGR